MDWKVQRDISQKIKEAAKSHDSVAAAKGLEEGVKASLESIGQAVDGYTNYTVPCVLAALKIVEKAITKMHARPEDVRIAEMLSMDVNFNCSAISIPYRSDVDNDD